MSKIKKIKLANGVYWIEIEDADLRVVCGCPADTVKHMIKRGAIAPNEANGVSYETGPNAILLSDVAVQKGSFANLAEFPVLQMLYRQGMIIPGHPGNTGAKPLLMGHQDQLDAQIKYIHRGNYGLTTVDEIMGAGIDAEYAHDMMRMKLKFAFGKISDSNELVNKLTIYSKPVEIQNGVFITRKSVNVFEFKYGEDSVDVDLNLATNEFYGPAYALGRYQVGREYFSIIHSGEGDGWDIDRPCIASIITFQGKLYLVDAGPNIDATLHALGIDNSEIEGVFLTHCHDDHFAGLPSLILSDHRIKFYSTPLVRHATIKKLSALMSLDESRFNLYFDVCDLEFDTWNQIDGLEVRPVFSPHPMETNIFFFRTQWGDGYKMYGHLADIASFDVMDKMVTADGDAPGISQSFCDDVKDVYLTPCDVKKIDNGGGMIHGKAADFAEDKTRKIILAHIDRPLREAEREIGSGSPFGTQDVLIPSNHNYLFGQAFTFLLDYFPGLPHDQFRLLLNHEVVDFNPEHIILKDEEPITYIYFILTGAVEMLDSKTHTFYRMSAGSFIGDMNGLYAMPSTETYRAISFVKALKLPMDMYGEFVKRNDIFASISKLAENRELLQKSWLCGEAIADSKQNILAAEMEIIATDKKIRSFPRLAQCIGLIKSGTITLKFGDAEIETLKTGDVIFEDHAIYNMDSIFTFEMSANIAVAFISTDTVQEIPVIQWKLLETINRRMRTLTDSHEWENALLTWRSEFSVGIAAIDEQHEKLLNLTVDLIQGLDDSCAAKEVSKKANMLMKFAKQHFHDEEKLFSNEGYSESHAHTEKHRDLIHQLAHITDEISNQLGGDDRERVIIFLKRWLVIHILLEDRKFASYMRSVEYI